MLSKLQRFHGHGSLRYVFSKGVSHRSNRFQVRITSNRFRKHSRISVIVSKKILKSAVGRNRIRRRVYEIVRHEQVGFTAPHDIAIIVLSAEVRSDDALSIYRELRELFTKSGLYKNPSSSDIL